MTYDLGIDVPPVRPEPVRPIQTPCVGGPWNGATITHMPNDFKDRHTNGGKYVHVGADASPGKGYGATWVWHQFIDGDGRA